MKYKIIVVNHIGDSSFEKYGKLQIFTGRVRYQNYIFEKISSRSKFDEFMLPGQNLLLSCSVHENLNIKNGRNYKIASSFVWA
jgi:hypothetical protein